MAKKFSIDSIMGGSDKNVSEKKEPIKVGAGLLNEASKAEAYEKMDIQYIPFGSIVPNEKNEGMSMEGIETLAVLIEQDGLAQPLEVIKVGDKYKIITGHRRFAAITSLINRGRMKYEVIPCIVKDLNKIDLPLSDELKEEFAMEASNTYRDKTDGDILLGIRRWKKIIAALKEQGVTVLPEELTVDGRERDIKGVRTQTLVAEQVGVSKGQVSKFEKVESKGSTELIDSMLDDELRMPVATAAKVADRPKDEQKKIIERAKDKKVGGSPLTKEVIDEAIAEVEREEQLPGQMSIEEDLPEIVPELNYTEFDLKDDIKEAMRLLKATGGISVSKSDKRQLEMSAAAIERVIKKYTGA